MRTIVSFAAFTLLLLSSLAIAQKNPNPEVPPRPSATRNQQLSGNNTGLRRSGTDVLFTQVAQVQLPGIIRKLREGRLHFGVEIRTIS